MAKVRSLTSPANCVYAALAILLAFYWGALSLNIGMLPTVAAYLAFVQAAVVVMLWQAEAISRVEVAAEPNTRTYSEKDALWWICPVANLWQPVIVMAWLWDRSGAGKAKWVLAVWWATWLGAWALPLFVPALGLAVFALAGVLLSWVVFRITSGQSLLEAQAVQPADA